MDATNNNSNLLISPKEEEFQTPPSKVSDSRINEEPIAANPISFYISEDSLIHCHDMVGMPTNKPETPSSTQNSSSRRGRRPKQAPEWIENWDVESKKRPNGNRFDKTYRHKEKGFLCRSLLECERYEMHGIRPQPRRVKKQEKEKEESSNKSKTETEEMVLGNENNQVAETEEAIIARRREEAESMKDIVEEFLAEAHYNQLHMFNP
ncbi:uncharacterized protein LOC114186781 [Vigna unguiculata]|uniref:uncharacterized protein LOC114186781 n=1 Tax=Vigna unguiculata TaxID=3917 RepID=UPI0010169C82|nr:uncharacterized protein LOC114186781 [Vigna unguiculata]